jgi:hypothetical protein
VADYERSTTSSTLDELPEPIRGVLRAHVESALLTVPDDAPAFLTHNKRLKKPGLFGRLTGTADKDEEHLTALVLAPNDVLVGIHGEQRGSSVLAARLEDADTSSLAERLAATGVTLDDDGVTVTGFPVSVDGGTGRGSFFVGLGPPDGERARAALTEAIRAAKSGGG